MVNLLLELMTTLQSLNVGTVQGNLFPQTLPMSPVVCTAVQLTTSPFNPADPIRQVGFQVIHRNTHIASGLSLVTSVHAYLANGWNVLPTIQGRTVAVNEPGGYVYDDDKRWAYFPLRFVLSTPKPY